MLVISDQVSGYMQSRNSTHLMTILARMVDRRNKFWGNNQINRTTWLQLISPWRHCQTKQQQIRKCHAFLINTIRHRLRILKHLNRPKIHASDDRFIIGIIVYLNGNSMMFRLRFVNDMHVCRHVHIYDVIQCSSSKHKHVFRWYKIIVPLQS